MSATIVFPAISFPAANAMLDECRFGGNGKMIVSEETDRIFKLELELKEIKKEVETLIKTI